MQQSKKINKKKTSTKKAERSPIFNEAMMFSVPAHTLSVIQRFFRFNGTLMLVVLIFNRGA
jgi:hypothetical protein